MTITKLLCLTIVIGLSYGHVHRIRRQTPHMVPMMKDTDGNSIMGMYMEEPPTSRNEPQDPNCQVQHNISQGTYDYNCGCRQRLGTDRPIGNLILNHTDSDCTDGLWVLWSELEAGLAPNSITFVGMNMTLVNQTIDEVADSSIKKLTFDSSTFRDLNEDAFKGLKELEELRFIYCNILHISTHAVRDHEKLKTVEIEHSIIGTIDENAFINLPGINDFAISFSIIDEIKSRGINLNSAGESHPCTRSGRSVKELIGTCIDSLIESQTLNIHKPIESMNVSDTVMGRQIQGARDVSLPSFGNRFVLLGNKIDSIRSNAVMSNAFGFLILGGNTIKLIEGTAFNMQLHNPCEISAAIFASNNITKLSEEAFAGISNKLNSNNFTFISLNNNKFDDVQAMSFQIERSIKIFSVDQNIFKCDCMNLSGFLKDQQPLSSVQAQLKMQIVDKANCTTGVGLKNFKYTCEEFVTTAPLSSTQTTQNSGTKTFSHSNLTSVVVTGFIMILINKIVP